jgi:hypothetical protein
MSTPTVMSVRAMSSEQLQARDIVRARQFGNQKSGTYVIDEVLGLRHGGDVLAVYAHNRSSGEHSSRYMILVPASTRVIGRADSVGALEQLPESPPAAA